MNTLELTQTKIIDSNIDLIEIETRSLKAACLKDEDGCAIFYDIHKFDNSISLNTALNHEFYHCEHNAFYTLDDTLATRKRREYKANHQMALELLPPDKLQHLLSRYELWEISEITYLSETFIKEAIRIYKAKGVIE